MKTPAFARAFGLDDDPLQKCSHLKCGYYRAPRSSAALALAEWTREDNYDATAWLPWPEMRQLASLWNHKIIPTALIDTEAGAASLLGFQDQSCLVLLHNPEGPTMRPVPWVFSLLPTPTGGAGDILVRRPHGTKFGQAVFSVCKTDETWLKIDEQSLSRGLRSAVEAVARLRAETTRIARSALGAKAPPRPGPGMPWSDTGPMLDFLPFVGWSAEQVESVRIIIQDLADWLASQFDPDKFRSLSITLSAGTPKDAGTDPVLEVYLTTLSGMMVQLQANQDAFRLPQIMSAGKAEALIAEIGPLKGLDFASRQHGHKPQRPRLAMARASTAQSNHRKLALHARFGAPRLPSAV